MKKLFVPVLLIAIISSPLYADEDIASVGSSTETFIVGLLTGGMLGFFLSNFYHHYGETMPQMYNRFESFHYKLEAYSILAHMPQEDIPTILESYTNSPSSLITCQEDLEATIETAHKNLDTMRSLIKALYQEFRDCSMHRHEDCSCNQSLLEKFEALEKKYARLIPDLKQLSHTLGSMIFYNKEKIL